MRELKFRAWLIGDREYDWHPIIDDGKLCTMDGNEIYGYEDENTYILEQYTGLKDKNGKEIYEGDIVLVANQGLTPYVVIYRDGDCSFLCSNEHITDYYHLFKSLPQCYEVIGNIHENPELLEDINVLSKEE